MKFKGEHKDDSLVHSVVSKLIFIVLLTGILYILQILSFFNHLVFTFVPCLVAHLPAVVCIIIVVCSVVDTAFYGRGLLVVVFSLVTRVLHGKHTGSESTYNGYVVPHDLDWNKHMNNAKYINTAALARIAYVIERDLWMLGMDLWKIEGFQIKYKKSFKVFEAFTVKTKLVAGAAAGQYLVVQEMFRRGDSKIKCSVSFNISSANPVLSEYCNTD